MSSKSFIGLFDLKQSSRQVADNEDGRHGSMASLQKVDGVQEEEVTRDYKDDQDSGWFGVHIWIKTEWVVTSCVY